MSKQHVCLNTGRRFLIKCLVLLAIIAVYILHLVPQFDDSYYGAMIDKVDRLTSIDEAKIVLIGNSNVAFGFDSEYIQNEMGMPVVNMGMHGGVGNTFHDNMMGYNVHEGDIYVVAHTSYWTNRRNDRPSDVWLIVENHPDLWYLVKPVDYLNMVKTFPAYVKKLVTSHIKLSDMEESTGAYARSAFNEYGDVSIDREYIGKDFSDDIWPPVVDVSEVEELNKWNEYLKERDASMVISAFPVIYDQWTTDDAYMDDYQKQLEEAMDCDVISDWKDYAYSSEYFYDTQYHLTNEGAHMRSIQLVKDLKTWQETK